jgi:16S rRNA (cytosine1402-N4)-methyltransferase
MWGAHASFAEIGKQCEPGSLDSLLADLGASSLRFETAARGFSFQAALDMRMSPLSGHCRQVVNHSTSASLPM